MWPYFEKGSMFTGLTASLKTKKHKTDYQKVQTELPRV